MDYLLGLVQQRVRRPETVRNRQAENRRNRSTVHGTVAKPSFQSSEGRARISNRRSPAAHPVTGGPSFDGIIAAGVQDGVLWVRKRRRKMIATVLSLVVSFALCCGGAFYWWDTQGKVKRARVEAERSCSQQVGRMTESYNKALRLYGQVSSKFSELDGSYDLDALAALQDRKPEGYRLLHCSTDLDGDVRDAKALKRSYDRLAVEYRKALVPVKK